MRCFKILCTLLIASAITNKSFCQKNCSYTIDTAKILANKNLDSFLIKFEKDFFKITNNKNDIPKFIKRDLDCLANDFSLANPGEPFQQTDVIFQKLPWRQLVFLAKSKDLIVLSYLKGGWGLSQHLVFIKFKNEAIIDFWSGYCSQGIKTKDQITDYIKKNRNVKSEFNSNIISL